MINKGENMKKLLILLMLSVLSKTLFAYTDLDMDGVDDSIDKCPNTPLTDLVDINGCTKRMLVSPHHFDIILGTNYSTSTSVSLNKINTFSSSLQVDYYYKKFSLQAYTSYYKTNGENYSDKGMNDSFVGAAYQLKLQETFSLRLGIGVLIPTYNSLLNKNNTDYTASANFSYTLGKVNIFGGYIYTIINDEAISETTIYQDTNGWSSGLGYTFTDKLYLSGVYNESKSIYAGIEKIKTISAYGYYSFSSHWFMTCYYAYGLSDSASDNAFSVKLGYYF